MRLAAMPKQDVTVAGKPCGTFAQNTVMTKLTTSCQRTPWENPMIKIMRAKRRAKIVTNFTMRVTSFCSVETCTFVAVASFATIPMRVRSEVRITTPTAAPSVHWLVLKAKFLDSNGSSCVCATLISNASGSPVSELLSTLRPEVWMSLKSAGTRSPPFNKTMSPMTSSDAGIRRGRPSRTTLHCDGIMDFSEFMTAWLFLSSRYDARHWRNTMMRSAEPQ
mmetsp:Transcript_21334/g.55437  ORF Transcript_21334/g.55437 Transcript_21334/m.55437 type:complete len:221 (+) Transcript_21334:787-1449(+)